MREALTGFEPLPAQAAVGLIEPQGNTDQNLGNWLRAFYATTEPLPEAFLAERDDQPPQPRRWP